MTTPPISRSGLPVTLDETVMEQIQALRNSGELEVSYRIEPRCHICCETESRDLVNKLLAAGLTNREISEACAGINDRRAERGDNRNIDARKVWNHAHNKHFDAATAAIAVYREIAERRAEEAETDYINGTGHLVTTYGLLETVMVKGYEQVTSSDARVDLKDAMWAGVKLHELTNKDASTRKIADMIHRMDRIIMAAKEFIPPDQLEAFVNRVEGNTPALAPMAALTESVHEQAHEVVREFVMPTSKDERDEL